MAEDGLEARIKQYLAENNILLINDQELLRQLIDTTKSELLLSLIIHRLSSSDPKANEQIESEIHDFIGESKELYHLDYSRGCYYYVRVALMKYLCEFMQTHLFKGEHKESTQLEEQGIHSQQDLQIQQVNQTQQSKVVVDYGCGYGLELCFLAREFPGNKFIGYDINPNRLDVARQRAKKYHDSRIKFTTGNYFKQEKSELSRADILYTNSPLAASSISNGKLKHFLAMMKERVKVGGIYALVGITPINTKYVPDGLNLESNPVICNFRGKDFYAYVFRRNN